MPRLTDQTYLSNYDALRDEYVRGGRSFIRLEPHEQWTLFGFYQHHERHSHAELLTYRHEISWLNQSLPQQAGKAFRHWQQLRELVVTKQPPARRVKRRNSTGFSLGVQVNPEPDPKRVARIVIDLASYLIEQERAREALESEPQAPANDSQSSGR